MEYRSTSEKKGSQLEKYKIEYKIQNNNNAGLAKDKIKKAKIP